MVTLVLALAVAGIVVVGGLVMMGLQAQGEARERAARLAADLGLRLHGHDELVGTYRGVKVRQYSKDLGGSSSTDWWTYTRCAVLSELPDGLVVANQGFFGDLADLFGATDLQVGNALDPLLRITADDAEGAAELLGDAEVTRRLLAILEAEGRIELQADGFELRRRGRHTEQARERLDEAVDVVRALAAVTERHWQGLVDRHGLAANADLTTLHGAIDGVPIQVELRAGRPRHTVVTAVFAPPLADGERLEAADGEGGARLGDPVLDGRISVSTQDPAALRARIGTDAVRGPLLEVLLGHPGSQVLEDRVHLIARGRLGRRLPRAVDAVVALAKGLRG